MNWTSASEPNEFPEVVGTMFHLVAQMKLRISPRMPPHTRDSTLMELLHGVTQ